MSESFTPSDVVLKKYADLIVTFGLQSRNGKKHSKGSIVQFVVPEVAKPLYYFLQASLLQRGYNPLGFFVPSHDERYNFDKNFFENANTEQLNFFADKYQRGLVD